MGSVDGPRILGIPGYDSLSASQVVQRLAGLSTAELRHVLAHESAGRHRRTILNRVDQLLDGTAADDGGATGRSVSDGEGTSDGVGGGDGLG